MNLFSPKGRHLVGLDVSTTSVKLVELQKQQGGLHLRSYGIEPLEPGWVVDKTIVHSEEVGGAIARLLRKSGASSKEAATAVSGSAVITKIIDMEAGLSDSDREAQIRLDAEQYIPYPLSEVNLDFEVLGPSTVNGLVRVLLAASRSENVEQRVETLSIGGLTTKVMDVESYAIERAFALMMDNLPNDPSVVALIDIGHKQMTLYIAKDGEFIYNREQGFGGEQLTEAIQNRYSMPYHDAVIGKHEYTLPADYHESVLQPFVESAVQQISRSLQFYFSSSEYNNVDHIVLCGGTAVLPGLAQMVQERMGSLVSVANPFEGMSVASRINAAALQKDAPSLMAACGLALRSFD
ncbi:MAG: pilus assembly protein PilM [Moraxella sp.]|nr:pilus assembly protein PilM [Moraxella sp.]